MKIIIKIIYFFIRNILKLSIFYNNNNDNDMFNVITF